MQKVMVTGRDILGRNAEITFTPNHKAGWHWFTHGKECPITPTIARAHPWFHWVELCAHGRTLPIIEHILCLRYFGIDGVTISVAPGIHAPYFGRPYELLRALLPHLHNTGEEMRFVQVDQKVVGGNSSRCTEITPNHAFGKLVLDIHLDFKDIGIYNATFGPSVYEECFEARPPAWTTLHRGLARTLTSLGWPHTNKFMWLSESSNARDCLTRIAHHRVVDLLGTLALVGGDKLLGGNVSSWCSGHRMDLEAITKIERLL